MIIQNSLKALFTAFLMYNINLPLQACAAESSANQSSAATAQALVDLANPTPSNVTVRILPNPINRVATPNARTTAVIGRDNKAALAEINQKQQSFLS